MLYYVYKTTNTLNGKFYIGAHRCKNLDDTYLGSGLHLNRAIRKYGREFFKREILRQCSSESEMFLYEALLVKEVLGNPQCYNLASGGRGGSIVQNRKPFTGKHSTKTKQLISKKNSGRMHSANALRKMRENSWSKSDPAAQREHAAKAAKKSTQIFTDERKRKVSKSLSAYFAKNGSTLAGKPKNKIECPNCKKLVAVNTAKRWHFSNCSMVAIV